MDRQSPIVYFYIGKIAIGNALLLTLLLSVSLLLAVIFQPAVYEAWVMFSTDSDIGISSWRMLSYLFYVPPSVWGIVHLIFLGYFGKEVEQSMERRDFFYLLLGLWLLPPLLACAAIPIGHSVWSGSFTMSLGVFLALVCLQPNRPLCFGVPIKWFGLVYLLGYSVYWIALRVWPVLVVHALMYLCVWWWMKRQGYARAWGVLDDMGIEVARKPKKRTNKTASTQPAKLRPRTEVDTKASSAVDRILDKVNREGLHSLTDKERRILQDASDEMK